jgi:4-hydroxy-3-methylbut-2-en-1-yl diphosphate reductase
MRISIEKKSGYCAGVLRVVELADEILEKGEELYSLGQVVHNELEINRLVEKGLKIISKEELKRLHNCKVLLRAHGEPPDTYEIASGNNIEIIDGTCPIVRKIQERIRIVGNRNEQVIIFGKLDHPEVQGLRAQVKEAPEVIRTAEEANIIKLSEKVHLYAQTTMDTEEFGHISSVLSQRIKEKGGDLTIHNTICGHVSHRKPGLIEFAQRHDMIIFLAGSNSSNGKILFEACKARNERCYFVADYNEIKKDWFKGIKSVGISGATSTPRWQIEKAYERVRMLTSN